MSKKTNLIDAEAVRTIPMLATELAVPERWLRNRVAAGEVESRRIGYNLLVPISEIPKIRALAARRAKSAQSGAE